jgi:NAD(P)-dependent dehydrogenase (short-subunit alcohol dehydrogenase family)
MQTVLVTGASSGIGLAAVEQIAAHQAAAVVATVRHDDDAVMVRERQRRLGHPVTTDLLDLQDPGDIERVVHRHRPDVIVNVAGDATFGEVLDAEPDEIGALLDQHVIGPVHLARAAVPHMRDAGGGRVVNVGSSLADTVVPMTGWYSAAKAALGSLTESLRVELADDGIAVVLVELGAVDTPAWDPATEADGPAGRTWARTARVLRPLFPDPPVAARAIAAAVFDEPPQARYRAGLGTRVLALSGRAPAPLREWTLGHLFGR